MRQSGLQPWLIVAPLTPFTAELKVDEQALRRQIDYVVRDCAATMMVAAGGMHSGNDRRTNKTRRLCGGRPAGNEVAPGTNDFTICRADRGFRRPGSPWCAG
jgi:hypothetical protein